MNILDKYSCIFCKYKKYNKNHDHGCMDTWEKDENGYPIGKCDSLSNIFYGKVIKHFPFKQIYDWYSDRAYKKEAKYNEKMDKKYGDCCLETDDFKFIWGMTSLDNLSMHPANMYTSNDIDIVYDKKTKEYMLGVETAFVFENYEGEANYLRRCLDAFGKYMDDNGLSKDSPYMLFMHSPCTSMTASSIEELYTNFKIFVDGFYCQDISQDAVLNYTQDSIKIMDTVDKNADKERKLKASYETFLQTERGKEWKHFWQSQTGSERRGDFGDYLYDFYPEMLQ